jgi:hypothetical protein
MSSTNNKKKSRKATKAAKRQARTKTQQTLLPTSQMLVAHFTVFDAVETLTMFRNGYQEEFDGCHKAIAPNTMPQRGTNQDIISMMLSRDCPNALPSCDNCHAVNPPGGLKKCASCRWAHYCSKECQRAHWTPECHKYICRAQQQVRMVITDPTNDVPEWHLFAFVAMMLDYITVSSGKMWSTKQSLVDFRKHLDDHFAMPDNESPEVAQRWSDLGSESKETFHGERVRRAHEFSNVICDEGKVGERIALYNITFHAYSMLCRMTSARQHDPTLDAVHVLLTRLFVNSIMPFIGIAE